jgi:hypothetical protein
LEGKASSGARFIDLFDASSANDAAVIPASNSANEIDISSTDVTVAGLMLGKNRTLNISVGHTLTVNGDSLIEGNLIGGGNFIGNGAVIFDGSSPQSIPPGSINSLNLNNAAGVSLLSDVTVQRSVTLTQGILNDSAFTLKLNAPATVGRNSGYVIGNFEKDYASGTPTFVYPVGTANGYSPCALISQTSAAPQRSSQ